MFFFDGEVFKLVKIPVMKVRAIRKTLNIDTSHYLQFKANIGIHDNMDSIAIATDCSHLTKLKENTYLQLKTLVLRISLDKHWNCLIIWSFA